MEKSKKSQVQTNHNKSISDLSLSCSSSILSTFSSHSACPDSQKRRKCRDIPCCILFGLFWIGILFIMGFALRYGDMNRIKYGTDFFNNTCGTYNPSIDQVPAFNATDLKYVHFLGLGHMLRPIPICVKSCPPKGSTLCIYGHSPSSNQSIFEEQLTNQTCAVTAFETENRFNRCAPSNVMAALMHTSRMGSSLIQIANTISNDFDASEVSLKISRALYSLKYKILGISLLSLLFSFIWLFLFNYVNYFLILLVLWFGNLALSMLTGFFWYNWYMLRSNGSPLFTQNSILDSFMYKEKPMLILAIITSVIFATVFSLTLICRKRIRLATLIGREASKALRSLPFVFVLPIFKFLVSMLLLAFFGYIFVLLSTSGHSVANATTDVIINDLNGAPFARAITLNRVVLFYQCYVVFGLVWTWYFMLSVWKITIAGAVSSWYWTRDKSHLTNGPLSQAFRRCFRFHLGSIALASLAFRFLPSFPLPLIYIQKRDKSFSSNRFFNRICIFFKFFFNCIDRVNALVSSSVFIEIAVYGYGFCKAVKLVIISLTFIVMSTYTDLNLKLENFDYAPFICVFLISWSISSLFTPVVDMANDTIFLCFCEDCERNDDSAQRPYYMAKSLKKFTDQQYLENPKFAPVL